LIVGNGSHVNELRNWAKIDDVAPLNRPSVFLDRWDIRTPNIALYSGNIGNKQGIEILVDVARLVADRDDLTFIICGQGPNRANLEALAQGLNNIRFYDLQPTDQLNELMGLATIHLLPQKASAADLVLPSKLTNMLASGRPVVATAHAGTGLAREVEGCGIIVEPEKPHLMAEAIVRLLERPEEYRELSTAARVRAMKDWNKNIIIEKLIDQFEQLVATSVGQPRRDGKAA
jgi:colanic acid biosynthesis glycosyl transferase WcaI